MKRLVAFLCAVFALTAGHASAQITIDASYYQSLVDLQITTTFFSMTDLTGVEALVSITGENQTFDFNPFTYGAGQVFEANIRTPSSDLPGGQDSDLTGADFVLIAVSDDPDFPGETYAYHDLRNDGLFRLGIVVVGDFDGNGQQDEASIKSSPAELLFPLPLTAGMQWTFAFNRTVAFQGIGITTAVSGDGEVDGWGMLKTPAGDASCLRVRETEQSTFAGMTTTTTTIDFLTLDGISADISVDAAGAVTSAGHAVLGSAPSTASETVTDMPETIRLLQNYPNPFNPGTIIPFELSEPRHVTLKVYNLLGQEVATLADAFLPAGTYTVAWPAETLPSGLYLYRLRTGEVLLSRTMTLLK